MANKSKSIVCAGVSSSAYEQPMSYTEAASALRISVPTLKYHIRKGRIRKVMIPGAKYAIGVIAADVRAILSPGTKSEGAR